VGLAATTRGLFGSAEAPEPEEPEEQAARVSARPAAVAVRAVVFRT
jgi:hypothetical protein